MKNKKEARLRPSKFRGAIGSLSVFYPAYSAELASPKLKICVCGGCKWKLKILLQSLNTRFVDILQIVDAKFEWHKKKAEQNLQKHGISFDEAKTVFSDELFITVVDEEHSDDEERFITIGFSNVGKLLMVAHTDRKGRIRIISARKATKNEEDFYSKTN